MRTIACCISIVIGQNVEYKFLIEEFPKKMRVYKVDDIVVEESIITS